MNKKFPTEQNNVFNFMDFENVISRIRDQTGVQKETKDQHDKGLVDIITFCEDSKYLGFMSTSPPINLTKVQRIILKCFYSGTEGNEKTSLSKAEEDWLTNWAKDKDKQKQQMIASVLDKHKRKVPIYELILVLGRRSGKCRSKDDLISTTVGSITFRELLERKLHGENIGILTYDERYKKRLTYDFSIWDNGIKPCAKITTQRGIVEISSVNHPYLVWNDLDEKPKFIRLDELKPGQRIAIAKSTDLFGTKTIGINRAKILGYLLGDGGIKNEIIFTNRSEKILEDLQSSIHEEFGDYELKYRAKTDYSIIKSSGKFKQNGSQKNDVIEWMKEIGLYGKDSHTKFIPECILKTNKEEISAFLSRLFSTDGWASVAQSENKKIPQIGYCSVSEIMIQQVRHLLLKFGIHCIVHKRNSKLNGKIFESFVLFITDSQSIEKFINEIGIFSKEKQLLNLKYHLELKNRSYNNHSLKTIPNGIWNYIYRIKKERKLKNRDITGGETYCGKRLRPKYSPCLEKIKEYGININDDYLQSVANADIFWDKVKSVELVGDKETVDLTVENTHIIGGDIISHNTMLASIVATYEAYKCLELYNPQEYYGLAPDNPIFILNVATAAPQARHLYNEIRSRIRNGFYFRDKLNQEASSEEYSYLLTQFDKDTNEKLIRQGRDKELIKGSIIIQCGHSNSNSLMGSGIICLIFDELAYFNDGSGKTGGTKVYSDLVPATKAFRHKDGTPAARIVEISAPAGKSGVFYSNYKISMEPEGEHMMAFQFPTWECSPIIKSKQDLDTEFKKNEAEATVRYGAEFSATMTSVFFPPECIDECIDHNSFCMEKGTPYHKYYMHVDPALTSHNYALIVLHQEIFLDRESKERKRKVIIDHIRKWSPSPGKEVSITEVENYIIKLCSKFHIVSITFDDWNSASTIQKFRKKGLPVQKTSFRSSYKQLIYGELRDLVVEKRLSLIPDELLIGEFKSLLYRLVGNGFKIMPDSESEYPTNDFTDCVAGAAHAALSSNVFDLPRTTVIKTKYGMSGMIPSLFQGKPRIGYKEEKQ